MSRNNSTDKACPTMSAVGRHRRVRRCTYRFFWHFCKLERSRTGAWPQHDQNDRSADLGPSFEASEIRRTAQRFGSAPGRPVFAGERLTYRKAPPG
jgi:hypothetical protein